MPKWTDNGFIIGPDGTEYSVQREQTLGAQDGGLVYYCIYLPPGAHVRMNHPGDTERSRRAAVQRIIENIIRKQLSESLADRPT